MLELYDKDASMSNYKHIETNEKNSFSTEIEDIKEYQMGTLELKNTITVKQQHGEPLGGNGTFLYPDYGGGYTNPYNMPKFMQLYNKKVNFNTQ